MLPVPLKLLEDHVVHATSGLNEDRGDDGERAGLLGLPGRGEQLTGLLQARARRVRRSRVRPEFRWVLWARARRVSESSIQHDSGPPRLRAFGTFRCRDRRCDSVILDILSLDRSPDFRGDTAFEIGDLLGAFVHQQDHHMAFRVILQHAESDVAEQGGLAGAGRGDDEPRGFLCRAGRRGPFARVVMRWSFISELQLLDRRDGRQLGEIGEAAPLVDLEAVDLLDEANLGVGESRSFRGGGGGDDAALLQLEAADQLARDEGIRRPGFAVARKIEAGYRLVVVEVEDASTRTTFSGGVARLAEGAGAAAAGGVGLFFL